MKYRRNKVKREHGIIQDALTWLEELSQCSEVADIIPGVIEVSRSPERGIVYKYETHTGCKILLKSNGSVQEAFVVTKHPNFIRQWIESHFPTTSEKKMTASSKVKANSKQKKVLLDDTKCEPQKATQPLKPKNKSNKQNSNSSGLARLSSLKITSIQTSPPENWLDEKYLKQGDLEQENLDLPNIGQRIDSRSLQALRALQKNLNQTTTRRKK